jgi:LCP family protein required for cell wall assembly
MPLVNSGDDDLMNILLLGSDTTNPENSGRTDVLMVVSINRTHNAVALLSIPRDLYVYVPDVGMKRINTAYGLGETLVEGTGAQLLIDTIQYNLGLSVDRYARVDFIGFKQIVDALGGLQVPVDCAIQDWRLREPDLDPTIEDNWEMFTLPIGMQYMDGDLALWYVRSRRTSSDLDRGRRQQDVLRALWRKLRSQEALAQLSTLWNQLAGKVETDLTLADALEMLPLAITIETSNVAYYTFSPRREVSRFISPAGQEALLPDLEAVASLMQQAVLPVDSNDTAVEHPTVGIVNVTGIFSMGRVAADRLELEGFQTVVLDEWSSPRQYNKIVDYTGGTNEAALSALRRVLRVTDEGVETISDPDAEYDFKVFLGSQYTYWTCTRDVIQPTAPAPTSESPESSG